MVGWLGGQWCPQPIRIQVLMLAFILNLLKSQDNMPAQSIGGAHSSRVCGGEVIVVSICPYVRVLMFIPC